MLIYLNFVLIGGQNIIYMLIFKIFLFKIVFFIILTC